MFSTVKASKVEHTVKEYKFCCCFPAVKFKMKKVEPRGSSYKRTCIKSTGLSCNALFNFLVISGILTGIDFLIKGRLMEFSLSEHPLAIKNVQKECPMWLFSMFMALE